MTTYEFEATVISVHDGDTVIMDVVLEEDSVDHDLGFDLRLQHSLKVLQRSSCRLLGINARELGQPGSIEARDHLAGLLSPTVTVRSVRRDKFSGRFDGLIVSNGVDVNAQMIADGYAAPWNGTGTRPVPPWPIGGTP